MKNDAIKLNPELSHPPQVDRLSLIAIDFAATNRRHESGTTNRACLR